MSISRILGNTAQSHTKETAMHHAISYQLAHARLADLRRHAQRATMARAVRRAFAALTVSRGAA